MADNKYGRIFTEQDVINLLQEIDCTDTDNETQGIKKMLSRVESTFPKDEPIFVLRGKDKRALAAVRRYRDNLFDHTHSSEHINSAEDAVSAFESFRQKNPERMKEPD